MDARGGDSRGGGNGNGSGAGMSGAAALSGGDHHGGSQHTLLQHHSTSGYDPHSEVMMFYEITVASVDQPKLLSRLSEALVRGSQLARVLSPRQCPIPVPGLMGVTG
jgi:hypothetical protein